MIKNKLLIAIIIFCFLMTSVVDSTSLKINENIIYNIDTIDKAIKVINLNNSKNTVIFTNDIKSSSEEAQKYRNNLVSKNICNLGKDTCINNNPRYNF